MKSLRNFALFLFPLFAISAALAVPQEAAPPREITGVVRSADGKPIANATVRLETFSGEILQQITPEGGGRFVFSNIEGGIYYVTVVAQGFRERRERADVLSIRRASIQVVLQPVSTPSPDSPSGGVVNQRLLRVPESARKDFEKGQQLLNERKPKEGLPYFSKAIEKHADFPEAYLLMGTAHMDLGEWKEAVVALQKSIDLDPKAAAAQFALGTAEAQIGDLQASEKALLAGLELEPESSVGHWEIARVYWTMKRIPEVETHTKKVLQIAPQMGPAHVMMGNVYLSKRDLNSALSEFKEYLRLEPKGSFAEGAKSTIARIEDALKKK